MESSLPQPSSKDIQGLIVEAEMITCKLEKEQLEYDTEVVLAISDIDASLGTIARII